MSTPAKESNVFIYVRKILNFLARSKNEISPLLILTHDHPDPDALASAYALHYLAKEAYGIQSKIVYAGVIGRMENKEMVRILKLPIQRLRPSHLKTYRHVALVDTQPAFENNPFPKNKQATMVLDQHMSVESPNARLAIVDTEIGATSVILAQAILKTKIAIPQCLATALVYGILSDTMNLYRSHNPALVKTYLSILPHSDLRALSRIQNPVRSRSFFTTLNRGIYEAMVRHGLIVAHLGIVESPDLVSQVADYLITFKRMHWGLCTGRHRGNMLVSLRLAKAFKGNAGEILRDVFVDRGQAGGHGSIAGGSFFVGADKSEEEWQAIEQGITDGLVKRLRLSKAGEFYHPFR